MAGIAEIVEENNRAALRAGPEAGPVLYAVLEALRRGTDRWSEADFRVWVQDGRRLSVAPDPTPPPEKGTPKRG